MLRMVKHETPRQTSWVQVANGVNLVRHNCVRIDIFILGAVVNNLAAWLQWDQEHDVLCNKHCKCSTYGLTSKRCKHPIPEELRNHGQVKLITGSGKTYFPDDKQ